MLKQQITEVHSETHMLLRKQCPNALINRELCAETDCVVSIDAECGRPEEYLVRLGFRHDRVSLKKTIGAFSYQLTKNAPVPLIWWLSPGRWTVSINEAVVKNVGPAIATVF